MVEKTTVKMSDENKLFWKRMNVNLIKIERSDSLLSFSDLQEIIVNFFKNNTDIYQSMLKSYEVKK